MYKGWVCPECGEISNEIKCYDANDQIIVHALIDFGAVYLYMTDPDDYLKRIRRVAFNCGHVVEIEEFDPERLQEDGGLLIRGVSDEEGEKQ